MRRHSGGDADPDVAAYTVGYTVQVSKDGENWITVLDRDEHELSTANQQALFTGLGQHVRVTVTSLPDDPFVVPALAEVAVLGNR